MHYDFLLINNAIWDLECVVFKGIICIFAVEISNSKENEIPIITYSHCNPVRCPVT